MCVTFTSVQCLKQYHFFRIDWIAWLPEKLHDLNTSENFGDVTKECFEKQFSWNFPKFGDHPGIIWCQMLTKYYQANNKCSKKNIFPLIWNQILFREYCSYDSIKNIDRQFSLVLLLISMLNFIMRDKSRSRSMDQTNGNILLYNWTLLIITFRCVLYRDKALAKYVSENILAIEIDLNAWATLLTRFLITGQKHGVQ